MAGPRVTPEELAIMTEAYEGGATGKEAAALCGRSPRTFYGIFKRSGGKIREHCHRTYSVDDAFFDVIDSEGKAYWAGMLASDGCISGGKVCLWLAEEDKEHIEKFKKAISAENPTYTKMDREFRSFGVAIYSKELVAALNRLGITERKSLIIEPPTNIADEYMHHFWRGCVDGDGGIYIKHSDKKDYSHVSLSVYLCGSEPMVSGFSDFISSQVETFASTNKKKDSDCYYINYSGVDLPKSVIKILYKGATAFLDRKKDVADRALLAKSRNVHRYAITQERLKSAYNEIGTWRGAARSIDVNANSVFALRDRLGLHDYPGVM